MTPNRLLTLAAIILVLGLPLRIYIASKAVMISRDGVVFIWYAQKLAEDPLAEMRKQAQHPLYPALILATHRVLEVFHLERFQDPVASWQFAAMAVTMIAGLTTILAVYALTRTLFDTKVALMAAVMTALAAEFCQHSADALTDMPHLTVYLFATVCAIRGLVHRSYVSFLLAGLLSGAAYLFRPEGAEVAVIAAAVALFRPQWNWKHRLAACLTVSLAALLIASPYMLITGKLVQKKPIEKFISDSSEPNSSFTPHSTLVAAATLRNQHLTALPRALAMILERWARSLRVTFALPALLWFAWRKKRPAEPIGGRMVGILLQFHLAILLALLFRFDYWDMLSIRHVFILAGLILPFSAAGLILVLEWLPPARRSLAGVLILAGLILPTLPWMLDTRFADERYLRLSGEWIRRQGEHARIFTTRHPVAFYANGSHVWSPLDANLKSILAEARWQKPDWLVFDEHRLTKQDPAFFTKLEAAAGQEITQAHIETQQNGNKLERAIVYRYNAPP